MSVPDYFSARLPSFRDCNRLASSPLHGAKGLADDGLRFRQLIPTGRLCVPFDFIVPVRFMSDAIVYFKVYLKCAFALHALI